MIKRVAIVEDTDSLAKLLTIYLSRNGHSVDVFSSYESFAASSPSMNKYDLFLLDHDIVGGVSGSDYLRSTNDIPISQRILMSASDSWSSVDALAKLSKPFPLSDLAALVGAHVPLRSAAAASAGSSAPLLRAYAHFTYQHPDQQKAV